MLKLTLLFGTFTFLLLLVYLLSSLLLPFLVPLMCMCRVFSYVSEYRYFILLPYNSTLYNYYHYTILWIIL